MQAFAFATSDFITDVIILLVPIPMVSGKVLLSAVLSILMLSDMEASTSDGEKGRHHSCIYDRLIVSVFYVPSNIQPHTNSPVQL